MYLCDAYFISTHSLQIAIYVLIFFKNPLIQNQYVLSQLNIITDENII